MYFSSTATLLSVVLLVGSQWDFLRGVTCDQQPSAILSNEVGVTSGGNGNKPPGFVSPTAASIPVTSDEQYRATYFYPVPHQVNWNRDSYADAASEFGYNPQSQQGGGHQAAATVSGPVYAPAYGGTGSDADAYDDSGFGGGALGGLGGLGGIAGILGLKGIKGLGLLALAKAAVPLLAILLPALLLLPLLFLFFPVPVITVPATGRSLLLSGLGDLSGKMTHLARSVLESDKCVERISCEVSRVSRGSFLDKTLKRVIPRFEPHMPQALRRIARVYLEGGQTVGGGSACSKKYTCYLMDDSNGGSVTAKKTAASTSS